MVIGAHGNLFAIHIVSNIVVEAVANNVSVKATSRVLEYALSFTCSETRTVSVYNNYLCILSSEKHSAKHREGREEERKEVREGKKAYSCSPALHCLRLADRYLETSRIQWPLWMEGQ